MWIVPAELFDLRASVLDAGKFHKRVDEMVGGSVGLFGFGIFRQSFTELFLGFGKVAVIVELDTLVKQSAASVFSLGVCAIPMGRVRTATTAARIKLNLMNAIHMCSLALAHQHHLRLVSLHIRNQPSCCEYAWISATSSAESRFLMSRRTLSYSSKAIRTGAKSAVRSFCVSISARPCFARDLGILQVFLYTMARSL